MKNTTIAMINPRTFKNRSQSLAITSSLLDKTEKSKGEDMGNRLLAIGAGLAMGAEKASANLFNIMKAKHDLSQQDELLKLKKKAIEADTELLPFQKEHYTAQIKSNQAHIAYYSAATEKAKQEAEYEKKQMDAGLYKFKSAIDPTKAVAQKVMTSGVESLTPGEKAVWDRGAKSSGANFDPFGEDTAPEVTTAPSKTAKNDDWWNQ
jgi:hypothetical protein